MLKFNNDNIFTGYIKQLLAESNLPKAKIFGKNSTQEVEGELKPIVSGPNVSPIYYIKDNFLQYATKDTDNSITWHEVSDYTEGYPELNLTKNLQIKSNTYDSYTHKYLGDYLRFQRDYNHLDLMSLYNCFSNEICSNIKYNTAPAGTNNAIKLDSSDDRYKIYMVPVKLLQSYTVAIDCMAPFELMCGFYDKYLNTTLTNLIAPYTCQHLSSENFGQPITFDKLLKLKENIKNYKTLTDDEFNDLLLKFAQNEQNLKLFIKIPASNKSSIVIIEHDMTAVQQKALEEACAVFTDGNIVSWVDLRTGTYDEKYGIKSSLLEDDKIADAPSESTGAFENCQYLKYVKIPATIETIGSQAFRGATNLLGVFFTADSNCTTINEKVFENCTSLLVASLPDKVSTIGELSFSNSGLISFTCPTSLTTIKTKAFHNCNNLVEVNLQNINNLEDSAFEDCSLKTVTIATKNLDTNLTIASDCFKNNTTLKTITILNNNQERSIDNSAFSGCTNIETINAPYKAIKAILSTIDIKGSLKNISINFADGVTTLGNDFSFTDYTVLENVQLVPSITTIANSCFKNNTSLKSFDFSNIVNIGMDAFYNCTNLFLVNQTLSLPKATTIGNNAFALTNAPTTGGIATLMLNRADTITTSWDSAFNNQTKLINLDCQYQAISSILTSTTFLNQIQRANVFCDNNDIKFNDSGTPTPKKFTNIVSITLHGTINEISVNCFKDCANLDTVNITDVQSINKINADVLSGTAFYNNTANWIDHQLYLDGPISKKYLTKIADQGTTTSYGYILDNQTKIIAVSVSSNTTKLTSIDLSNNDSLTFVGQSAFNSATGIKTVIINKINYNTAVFEQSSLQISNLEKIILPIKFITASVGTFNLNGSKGTVKELTLLGENNNRTIAADFFKDTTKLKNLTIKNISTIGDNAFKTVGSTLQADEAVEINIDNIDIYETQLIIGDNAFNISNNSTSQTNKVNVYIEYTTNMPVPNIGVYAATAKLVFGLVGNTSIYLTEQFIDKIKAAEETSKTNWTHYLNRLFVYSTTITFTTNNGDVKLTWTDLKNGTRATELGYNKNAFIDNDDDTRKIDSDAFTPNTTLVKQIWLDRTVVEIASNAIHNCPYLESVRAINADLLLYTYEAATAELTEQMPSIYSCASLTTLSIADNSRTGTYYYTSQNSVFKKESIPAKLVIGCKGTVLPNPPYTIATRAFYNCIPNGLNFKYNGDNADILIQKNAFYFDNVSDCPLVKINMPEKLDTATIVSHHNIKVDAESTEGINAVFFNNIKVEEITCCMSTLVRLRFLPWQEGTGSAYINLKSTVKKINLINEQDDPIYVSYIIQENTFKDFSLLENITIPDSVRIVKSNAFKNCSALKKLILPDTLVQIGDYSNISIEDPGVRSIISGCKSLTEISLPFISGVLNYNLGYRLTLPGLFASTDGYDDITELYKLDNDTSYSYVYYNDDVTPITYSSKGYYCYLPKSLKKITVKYQGEAYNTINPYAFQNCAMVEEIYIDGNITKIWDYAFKNCKAVSALAFDGLKTLSITNKVTDCSTTAFDNPENNIKKLTCPTIIFNSTADSILKGLDYLTFNDSGDSDITINAKNIYVDEELYFNFTLANDKKLSINGNFSRSSDCKVIIKDIGTWLRIVFKSDTSNPLWASTNLALYLDSDQTTPITHIAIPDGIDIIYKYSLAFLNNIQSVSIPASVIQIQEFALMYPNWSSDITTKQYINSATITVDSGNTRYSTQNGLYEINNNNKTRLVLGQTDTTSIPATVTVIDAYSCYKLNLGSDTIIKTTSTAIAIGRYAFAGTTAAAADLTSCTVALKLAYGVFSGSSIKYANLKGIQNLFDTGSNTGGTSSTHGLPEKLFCNCASLHGATDPSKTIYMWPTMDAGNQWTIGEEAFAGCKLLGYNTTEVAEEFKIPVYFTTLDHSCFSGCFVRKEGDTASQFKVKILDGTNASRTAVYDSAFANCTNLTEVYFGNAVKWLYAQSSSYVHPIFYQDTINLTTIKLNNSESSVTGSAGSPWGATSATVQWLVTTPILRTTAKRATSKNKVSLKTALTEVGITVANPTNKTNKYIINYEYPEAILAFKPITKSQLLSINTGEQYPFADRLIEYLVGNAVTNTDVIGDNVKRIQAVAIDNNIDIEQDGAWSNILRCLIYEQAVETQKSTLGQTFDVLGYLDKDAEKTYSGPNLTANTVNIYKEGE